MLALTGCGTFPYAGPHRPHASAEGFRNNYPHPAKASFWAWKRAQWREGLPPPAEGRLPPVIAADVAFLRANRSQDTLTWIGHASFLLQIGGLNVLTDPHLTERASPVTFAGPRRVVPPALDFAQLPHIDVVVISHNHYDHLDLATVARLAGQPGGSPRFLVGLGLARWFVQRGMHDVEELDWWERREIGGVGFRFVPVQHWSKRTLWDANQTLWGGWIIERPALSVFHAGDAGHSADFRDIAERAGSPDVALLPIGAYAPRWFMATSHIDPDEAVRVHLDLRARRSVAMHWGTFQMSDEPLDEPPRRLAEALARSGVPPERFVTFRIGETRRIERDRDDVRLALPADARAAGAD